MDNNKSESIKVEPLTLQDATQRIEHQFEMSNARFDRILFELETINANLNRKLIHINDRKEPIITPSTPISFNSQKPPKISTTILLCTIIWEIGILIILTIWSVQR